MLRTVIRQPPPDRKRSSGKSEASKLSNGLYRRSFFVE
jgi:hypothetical protein